MILTVTLNPSVDYAMFVQELRVSDTNRVIRTERDAGGKGVNLARVVAELGSTVLATGFLAGGAGAYVRRVLDQQGVSHCFVEVAGETRTNFSVEDESDTPPTTFNERGPEVTAESLLELEECVRELLGKVKWLVLGGSLPPGVPDDVYRRLGELGQAAGCRVMLDADGICFKLGLTCKPDFVKPNSQEASRLLGRPVETDEQAFSAACELYDSLLSPGRAPIVVISRGADGAVLCCSEGLFNGLSPQVEPRSTIGSGDSLIAGMLWAIDDGRSVEEAFRWGIAAGAATATTNGSEIARRPVILELLDQVETRRVGELRSGINHE